MHELFHRILEIRFGKRRNDSWRIVAVLLISVMIASISGCGKPEKKDSRIHLRFACFAYKQEADLAARLAAAFEKDHPNVKIDIEPIDGLDYQNKLAMQSAAGTLPDVVMLADALIPTLTSYKVLLDLKPFAQADKTFNLSDIYPQMLQAGMGDKGEIYMMPRELGVVVMFYNRTAFRKAGLPDPKPDWTYDEFLQMAKKLTIKDADGNIEQYGFYAPYAWSGFYSSWVESNGGKIVSKDHKKVMFDDPAVLKGLRSITDLVTKDSVAASPQQATTLSGTVSASGMDPFSIGKVAMMPQIFPQVAMFRTVIKKFDWDVQILPRGTVSHVVCSGSAGYGISADTKHPQEAWQFVSFIARPEGQRIFASGGNGIPVLKSLRNDPCWRKSGLPPANLDAFIQSTQFATGPRDRLILDKPEVGDLISAAFDDSFNSLRSTEDAFREVSKKINKILKEEEE